MLWNYIVSCLLPKYFSKNEWLWSLKEYWRTQESHPFQNIIWFLQSAYERNISIFKFLLLIGLFFFFEFFVSKSPFCFVIINSLATLLEFFLFCFIVICVYCFGENFKRVISNWADYWKQFQEKGGSGDVFVKISRCSGIDSNPDYCIVDFY